MQTSEHINELAAALSKAQGQFSPALKDAENAAFKQGSKVSKYADIAAVWEAIRKPLSDNGLAVIQQPARTDAGIAVTTQLMHSSGQWIRFEPLIVPMFKQDAHGVGSATTYGRRFSLCAALGIVADEDDDGSAASGKAPTNGHDEDAPKNAPGISKARTWASELIRDAMACENGEALCELLSGTRTHLIRICGVYPGLWNGPDGSGLRGEIQRIASIMEIRPWFDAFISGVEETAKKAEQEQV